MITDSFRSVGSTIIFWKRLSRAPSFSTILRNSSIVVAPMHCSSPRANAGLSMLAASRLPCPPPAPTIVWNSSMNSIRSGSSAAAFNMVFTRFSKSPRYLVPATTDAMSSVMILFLANAGEMVPAAIFSAMPSTIADLPTPGSPISIGLFFFRRPRISMTREISSSLPTTGSSLPSAAALVRSMPNSLISSCFFVSVVSVSPKSSPSSPVSVLLVRRPFFSSQVKMRP